MATIPEIKNLNDSEIRQKNTPRSITTDNVADAVDRVGDELVSRGCIVVDNTTALQAQLSANTKQVFVKGVGLFVWQASGTANGTTIFDADDTGVYVLEQRTTPETLYTSDGTIDSERSVTIQGNGSTLNFKKDDDSYFKLKNDLSTGNFEFSARKDLGDRYVSLYTVQDGLGIFSSKKDNSAYAGVFSGLDVYGYSGFSSSLSAGGISGGAQVSAALQIGPPYVYILGAAAFQGAGQAPDADYEVPHASFIRLDNITANRNLILKIPNFGAFLIIFVNNNNSSFNWIVSGAVSVKNPSGSSVTSLDNKAVYTLIQGSGASEWVVASKYNT